MKIEITWQVEDGYAGGSRPQHTNFETLDYVESDEEWNNLSEQEKQDYYDQAVQEDFNQSIFFNITNVRENE